MTDVTRMTDVQFGLHSNSADFSSTPGTLVRILPTAMSGLYPRQRTPIERPLYSSDNRRYLQVRGARDLSQISVTQEMCGMNNSSGGAVTVQSVMEQGYMLDAIFGASAAAISGAATTVTGGTPASAQLTVTSGTNIANGDMVLFRTGSATGPVVMREVAAGGGTGTLTFTHVYTGTPFSTGTVYRAARWNLSTSTTHHTHGYFRAEGENWRRDYYGCFPNSMRISIPDSGPVSLETSWTPTDWADVAEANPSFSEPSRGSPTVSGGCEFRIASTAYLLRNASITLANAAAPRGSVTGPNGVQGYVATSKWDCMLEGELYLGDNGNTIGELQDSTGTPSIDDLAGSTAAIGATPTARDIMLAVGGAQNASFLIRIPAADFRGSVQDSGGLAVFRFQAMASVPASGSAFRLGVF